MKPIAFATLAGAAALLTEWGCDYLQGALIGRASVERPWSKKAAPTCEGSSSLERVGWWAKPTLSR